MTSLSLTVQKLWPRLKGLFLPQSQTGQKLDAPKFHSGGIIIIFKNAQQLSGYQEYIQIAEPTTRCGSHVIGNLFVGSLL